MVTTILGTVNHSFANRKIIFQYRLFIAFCLASITSIKPKIPNFLNDVSLASSKESFGLSTQISSISFAK